MVGNFSGTFEGLGNSISNLSIYAPTWSYVWSQYQWTQIITVGATDVGLFRANSGTVRDFALVGGSVGAEPYGYPSGSQQNLWSSQIASGAQEGYLTTRIGSLAANNSGLITNVATSAAVSGIVAIGGLVGSNTGTILNSTASGAVTGQSSNGFGSYNVGGLVGLNYTGTVSGSWATGDAEGMIHNSFATGAVKTGANAYLVGGLVGTNNANEYNNVYATAAVTVGANSNGVGGLSGGFTNTNLVTSNANNFLLYSGFSTGRVSAGAGSTNVDASIGLNYVATYYHPQNANGYNTPPLLFYNSDMVGICSTHLTVDLKARGQLSFNQALPRSEQIGVVSSTALSSFDSGLFQGDDGLVVRGEVQLPFVVPVTLPFWLPSFPAQQGAGLPEGDTTTGAVLVSPYGFGAVGQVHQQRPTAVERPWIRGVSYGTGLRIGAAPQASFTNVSVTVEYGRQERSDRRTTGDRVTFAAILKW